MPNEHDKAFRHTFKLWCEHGLTFSQKKGRLNLQAVKFFEKVFSSEGKSPDSDKVATLKEAVLHSQPQRHAFFLFFAEATTDFIEGFAQDTAPFTELLLVITKFQWISECQRSFERVQEMLTDDTVMAYFDP